MADDSTPSADDPTPAPLDATRADGPRLGPGADGPPVRPGGRPAAGADATQVGPPARRPDSDATQVGPPLSDPGATQIRGGATPGRPGESDLPGDATQVVGEAGAGPRPGAARPDATSMLPAAGPAGARWEARAQVRPATPGAPPAWDDEPIEDPYGGRSWFTPVIVGIVALVLLAALGFGLYLIVDSAGDDDPQAPASATVPATEATSEAPTSAAPSSESPSPSVAAEVTVPEVEGDSVATATRTLTALGLKVVTENRPGSEPAGTVLGTSPGADSVVEAGSTVTLLVSSGPTSAPPRTSAAPSPSATASRT